jgi:hypothetical protein
VSTVYQPADVGATLQQIAEAVAFGALPAEVVVDFVLSAVGYQPDGLN